ncbi:MAG: thiamine pyrophosphate-dependent enzyme [Proteobacteria bacterium]|nr:thiamine pyrophosphate-dependent enzyme [Pseudomonadota bacterium]
MENFAQMERLTPATDPITDYTVAYLSRQLSVIARKEVAKGHGGFAILGEGKELAQIAMAKTFRLGDWRSGYYRDQTFMLAVGALTAEQFFAQIYAHPDTNYEPSSGGRQMNCHYSSRFYHHGEWQDQTQTVNVAADMSCTSGQLPRLIGLGYSSYYYRVLKNIDCTFEHMDKFSHSGHEVAFGTVGDAATAEGHFWETVNAMGVLQIPVALSIWDDGYGISVPRHLQTTKGSLKEILPGFTSTDNKKGVNFFAVKGWDYEELINTYQQAIQQCRDHHEPCVILVDELTQPLGHSTSGSHSRYKSEDRLNWEKEHDCLWQFRSWLLRENLASEEELLELEKRVTLDAMLARDKAFQAWQSPFYQQRSDVSSLTFELQNEIQNKKLHKIYPQVVKKIDKIIQPLSNRNVDHWQLKHDEHNLHHGENISNQDNLSMAYDQNSLIYGQKVLSFKEHHSILRYVLFCLENSTIAKSLTTLASLRELEQSYEQWGAEHYRSTLFVKHCSPLSCVNNAPVFQSSNQVDGRLIIRDYFGHKLAHDSRIVILGEDVGALGGVNLEFEGLYDQFPHQMIDTGIREATIVGQGHGMALRGLRPVIDIQYLDYLIFCLQGMSDDIASLHYRTHGGQVSPVIIRSKGHRLMGIWHSGSPMAMILHTCRGIHLCTPRNMVQAAGMYETLLSGDDPGIVIEPMNGYRKQEYKPENIGYYTIPLGVIEILKEGRDITVVTYGACCSIALSAAKTLQDDYHISLEVIDCQTLHPFDLQHHIRQSIAKTYSLIILDEDVPGGAGSYILKKILEDQKSFELLDSPPVTISAAENRPAYSVDGDYYCKPQPEDLIQVAFKIMADKAPQHWHRSRDQ